MENTVGQSEYTKRGHLVREERQIMRTLGQGDEID